MRREDGYVVASSLNLFKLLSTREDEPWPPEMQGAGQGDQCQAHPLAVLVLSRCVAFFFRVLNQDKQAIPPMVSSTSSRQHCSSSAVGTGSVVLQRETCPCCLPSN